MYVFGKQIVKKRYMYHFLSVTMKLRTLKLNNKTAKMKHMVDRNYISRNYT